MIGVELWLSGQGLSQQATDTARPPAFANARRLHYAARLPRGFARAQHGHREGLIQGEKQR